MEERGKRAGGEESGFTLFELVIVLAIIGILVAVAIPAYKYVRFRGFISEARQAANEFRALVWACRVQTQTFDIGGGCDNFGLIGFTGTSTNWNYNMSASAAGSGTSSFVIFYARGPGFVFPERLTSNDLTYLKEYSLTINFTGGITESVPSP